MRFGAFDIWGVSGAVKFLSISVTLGFCAHNICGLHGISLWAAWMLTAPPTQQCEEEEFLEGPQRTGALPCGFITRGFSGRRGWAKPLDLTLWITQALSKR